MLQDRLGVPKDAGALDFNLGCSGFVYGLGLAKGLIESGQARSVLLITADTISKLIHPEDKSVRLLFGDAGAATLVQGTSVGDVENFGSPLIAPFVFGTDGRGTENLIVRAGGTRKRCSGNGEGKADQTGNAFPSNCLYMNGPEIFTFTLQTVPQLLNQLLSRSGRKLQDIDLFVFHQANQFMLEQLRKKLNIPTEKFVIAMRHSGNTASATIPIALKCALQAGRLKAGALVMLAGFGVGYSWESTLVRWTTASEGEVGDCQHARTQQEPA